MMKLKKLIKNLRNLDKYVDEISKTKQNTEHLRENLLYDIGRKFNEFNSVLNERISKLEVLTSRDGGQFTEILNAYTKEFEKRIQNMAHAYTANLDDVKSDYLKRYLETRINCISEGVPVDIKNRFNELENIINKNHSELSDRVYFLENPDETD